jgi:hypothetical protein
MGSAIGDCSGQWMHTHHYKLEDDDWLKDLNNNRTNRNERASYVKNSEVEGKSTSGNEVRIIPSHENDPEDDFSIGTLGGVKSLFKKGMHLQEHDSDFHRGRDIHLVDYSKILQLESFPQFQSGAEWLTTLDQVDRDTSLLVFVSHTVRSMFLLLAGLLSSVRYFTLIVPFFF